MTPDSPAFGWKNTSNLRLTQPAKIGVKWDMVSFVPLLCVSFFLATGNEHADGIGRIRTLYAELDQQKILEAIVRVR